MSDLDFPHSLRFAIDGSAALLPRQLDACQPQFQVPPLPKPGPKYYVNKLKQQYQCWGADSEALLNEDLDVGHVLMTRFDHITYAPECSTPTCFVEPSLPSYLPANSSGPPASIGWSEKTLDLQELARLDALGLHRRMAGKETGQDTTWLGFSVSMPFLPGSTVDPAQREGGQVVATAAEEANTGSWLRELESGQLASTCAPGLTKGLFGAWARDASDTDVAGTPDTDMSVVKNNDAGAGEKDQGALSLGAPTSSVLDNVFKNMWLLEEDEDEADEGDDDDDADADAEINNGGVMADKGGALGDNSSSSPGRSERGQGAGAGAGAGAGLLPLSLDLPGGKEGSDDVDEVLLSVGIGAAKVASKGGKVHSGTHEWAVRNGVAAAVNASFEVIRPNLAMRYPFELDIFQKEAICDMEAGRSVFVAAHTSAGKTVVAEYAFALATRHCTRAIYTSPIKTISNQKFRDFNENGKFEVGLLTGDVQIKPDSPCLIMTTEILRSMLYKGADVIRDIEWVVFDEVHYVNDPERGVVWEEVIIMLPPHINLVMLSATVPNVMDFADWVGRTKRKVIHVTGTLKRPVPLEHMLFYGAEIFPICNKDVFSSAGVTQAVNAYKRKNDVPGTKKDEKAARPTGRGGFAGTPNRGGGARGGGGGGGRGGGGHGGGGRGGSADNARRQIQQSGRGGGPNSGGMRGERTQMLELINLLTKKALLPVAFFCFSKKRCDSSADNVSSLDMTTSMEKHTIHVFLEKCLSRLSEGDRKLPQILRTRDLLRRGLGCHHAGLLPIMKEVVEMLFCQGYIKVLFCTETFAMGVNAPTRTVVFHSLRKHDGKSFRYLLPGEYTQMAGRAGRRGLDPVGTVIIACWEDILPEGELRNMITGRGVTLESQFRLTYSMILNLLRVEDLKVEDMLKRSFAEWRAQKKHPEAIEALEEIEKQLTRVKAKPWPSCYLSCSREEVGEYYKISNRIDTLTQGLQATLMESKLVQQQLVPGRVVLFQNPVNGLSEVAMVIGSPVEASLMAPKKIFLGNASPAAAAKPVGGFTIVEGDPHLYLLVLHRKGSVDDRHMKVVEEERRATGAAVVAKPKAADNDEFAGMVMQGSFGKGAFANKGAVSNKPGPLPHYGDMAGCPFLLVEIGSRDVVGISKTKLKVESADFLCGDWENDRSKKAIASSLRGMQTLQEKADASGEEIPLMDPRSDLKVNDIDAVQAMLERACLMAQRAQLRPHKCPSLSEQYGLVRAADALNRRRIKLAHELSDESLAQMPEFQVRVKVLQELGHLDAERTVQLKGRVLCEINSTQDELVATEMVFSGLLTDLSPPEAVALISSLVFQEKSDVEPTLPPGLSLARENLRQLVLQLGGLQKECGLDIAPEEYVTQVMHVGLMEVVYEWAKGTPFHEICALTDVMEGSIVRAVVRLDQACREFMDAARVMGNTVLFQQMQQASALIKRDVVFAASLYVA